MNSSYQANENLIFKTPLTDEKIYIREQSGRYQKIRRVLSFVLIFVFALIPMIEYQGHQAVYFDLQQQKIHLFSFTLFPQDFLIFTLIFILAAFVLFYVTKFYGRVWCGFTCPQTIWMLIFNWVERRVEGTHNQSRALDRQGISTNKIVKKALKHFIWGSLSLITSLIFISYFVPAKELYPAFFQAEASSLVVLWVLFFAGCTYINAGWIREKMCQHMCPYARFQSAMFDPSTTLVTYDANRGENRAKRKRSQVKTPEQGDCIDCNLCVQVCPVGIDIRDGLQYECINCGLCADACDMTMKQFNTPTGLIAFKQEVVPKTNWSRHLVYGSIVGVILLAIYIWANTWQSFEVNIIRDRQDLYSINQNGHVENHYIFKIRNKTLSANQYEISVNGFEGATIENSRQVEILPGELRTISVVVYSIEEVTNFRSDLIFSIQEVNSKNKIDKVSSFYSGNKGW